MNEDEVTTILLSSNLKAAVREEAQTKGVSMAAVIRWALQDRYHPSFQKAVGSLLHIAQPEQQRALLEALGIEDVTQFAADLLASAGVMVVQVEGKMPNGS